MGAVGQIILEPWNPTAAGEAERLLAGSDCCVSLIGILFERARRRLRAAAGAAAGRDRRRGRQHGLERVVHVSAIGADPRSPAAYARTKAAGEAARAGRPSRRRRSCGPSIVFGPEDGFFNRFARMSQLSPALPLIGGGRTRFQPVYVGDVAEAVVAALTRPDVAGRTYELGGPTIYTLQASCSPTC